ncbi:Shikimate o-hydroxycinnamoyltransferase [Thalictrum thalictroides]|uniref:Shikimate o-hydroxycinnamoyltransferase n=1 Tax=Thalictrum thalictroides TaxID=46969 RepID=A0A7J6W883_THATH|nr:Shikimate o-hydroxycinnamoyltransferase [Thalictrum thalictroides]
MPGQQPPTPSFPHIEHQPPPTVVKCANQKCEPQTSPTAVATFKITRNQINSLKAKCKNEFDPIKFSSYEVLAGHIWRCASKARNLQNDQETSVSIIVDGRTRLNPPLPFEYLGNAVFYVTPRTTSGDIVSKPLVHAVRKVHDALGWADDKYLRSALDYLEIQPDISSLVRGPHTFGCPNLGITSWCRMPLHDADFGWGKPVYMGPASIMHEGLAYILPSPSNDGNLSLTISLQSNYLVPFKQYLYEL